MCVALLLALERALTKKDTKLINLRCMHEGFGSRCVCVCGGGGGGVFVWEQFDAVVKGLGSQSLGLGVRILAWALLL